MFEDGFTLEAAEAVVDVTAFPASPPVLDVVQALVDRSLLTSSAGGEEPRFGMHASIKEFAREKLRADDAEEDALARHGRHFATFGSWEATQALRRHGGVARMRRMECDLGNVVVACRRAVRRGEAAVAAAACIAAWVVLSRRGPYAVGASLAAEVLSLRCLDPDSRLETLRIAAVSAPSVGGGWRRRKSS